jgi:hypothetical protein
MTIERISKLNKDDYLEAKVTGKIPLSGRWEGQNTPTRLEKKKISLNTKHTLTRLHRVLFSKRHK